MPDVDPVTGWWPYESEPTGRIVLASASVDVLAAKQTAKALERMRASGASEDEIRRARVRLAVR
jgi:hypothetical protein